MINSNFPAIQDYLRDSFDSITFTSLGREADLLSMSLLHEAYKIAVSQLVNQKHSYEIKIDSLSMLKRKVEISDKIKTILTAIRAFCNVISNMKSQKLSHLVKLATQYIDNNYFRNDLCLKTLAVLLSVHPSYLGRRFKIETHQFFNDYLARIRVQHAEELLCSTSMKVAEVAEAVGFSSINYFERIFKKITLSTPSDYRIENFRTYIC